MLLGEGSAVHLIEVVYTRKDRAVTSDDERSIFETLATKTGSCGSKQGYQKALRVSELWFIPSSSKHQLCLTQRNLSFLYSM